MSDHSWDFFGHEQILVNQCWITDCHLQPCVSADNNLQNCDWTFVGCEEVTIFV